MQESKLLLSVGVLLVICSVCTCSKTPKDLGTKFLTTCVSVGYTAVPTCENAWTAFVAAFSGKTATDVKESDYDALFKILMFQSTPDKTLFWSGEHMHDLVEEMQKKHADVITSSSAPPARIFEDLDKLEGGKLNWCGDPVKGGIDYTNDCPDRDGAVIKLWRKFSILLAAASSGKVFWVGNGEPTKVGYTAYSGKSVFTNYELPNLDKTKVTELIAIVIHRNGFGESCSQGKSMLELQQTVTAAGLKYRCIDHDDDFKTAKIEDIAERVYADIIKALLLSEIQEGEVMMQLASYFRRLF